MATPPPSFWVNAYERIVATVGGFLPSRQILWFDPASFVVTDNASAKRTEVAAFVGETAAAIVPVTQPPIANGQDGAGGSTRTILAYADTEKASHFGTVSMFAGGALTASNTDYVVFTIWDCDESGTHNGAALYTGDTRTFDAALRPNSTGSWSGGALAISVGLGADIAAGHSLAVEWDTATHAATRLVPGGWFRTK